MDYGLSNYAVGFTSVGLNSRQEESRWGMREQKEEWGREIGVLWTEGRGHYWQALEQSSLASGGLTTAVTMTTPTSLLWIINICAEEPRPANRLTLPKRSTVNKAKYNTHGQPSWKKQQFYSEWLLLWPSYFFSWLLEAFSIQRKIHRHIPKQNKTYFKIRHLGDFISNKTQKKATLEKWLLLDWVERQWDRKSKWL